MWEKTTFCSETYLALRMYRYVRIEKSEDLKDKVTILVDTRHVEQKKKSPADGILQCFRLLQPKVISRVRKFRYIEM